MIKIPLATLSNETVDEFNNLIHQAIEHNNNSKETLKQIFKIWKYFLKTNIHTKENFDGSIGDETLRFGVVFAGKKWMNDDLMNNMMLCHNLFTNKEII